MERVVGRMALLTKSLLENRGGDSFYSSREVGSGLSCEHLAWVAQKGPAFHLNFCGCCLKILNISTFDFLFASGVCVEVRALTNKLSSSPDGSLASH